MPFVGRDAELSTLDRLYASDRFEMPIIYGRRRVGKTSLISRFIQGKPAIYFSALESTPKENLIALSRAIVSLESDGIPRAIDAPALTFNTFGEAFTYVFDLARTRRIVFVIDEYPYLALSDRSVSSVLQHYIDAEKDTSKLFLILCGSSMSFMEHQVLGYKSPLYGRRTAQIRVEPFTVMQAAKLLHTSNSENVVSWYGIVGGVPLYLEQFNPSMNLQENMAFNVLRPASFLYGEPDSFLQQEVREPARYNALIRTIAKGEGKLTEIADSTGIERSAATGYIKGLMELGIIRQEKPVVDANRKKVRYVLSDNLFRFWYRFVPQYLTPIQAGRFEEVSSLIASKHLSSFLGPAFEETCRQWLVASMGTNDIPLILDIGRWWGNDPERKVQAEMDIVATCDNGDLICGECKWREKPADASVLTTLQHRASLIKGDRKVHYIVFSKSGFTDECRAAAEKANCALIGLSDMGLGA